MNNISSYSTWEYISNTVGIKVIDKSLFDHHGTGISKSMLDFWNLHDLGNIAKKNIILLYKNKPFEAHFQKSTKRTTQIRLFWRSDFSKAIAPFRCFLAEKQEQSLTYIRFEKKSNFEYYVTFINSSLVGNDDDFDSLYAEQLSFKDGKKVQSQTTRYERDYRNRLEAIKIHGTKCCVCGFDFESFYGVLGVGFIEIHHLTPLFLEDKEIMINPRNDLAPICSNCHRMIHRDTNKILTIEELRLLVKKNKCENDISN